MSKWFSQDEEFAEIRQLHLVTSKNLDHLTDTVLNLVELQQRSTRKDIAAQALQGMLASPSFNPEIPPEKLAAIAVQLAIALENELEKNNEKSN